MESRNQRVWIIIFVVVALACLALITAIAVGVAWFFPASSETGGSGISDQARIEESFEVGTAPHLEIDNVAGNVTVEVGEGSVIHVIATKRALRARDLDRIEVEMTVQDDGLWIRTRRPGSLQTASVDLQVTAPAGTDLRLHTGAGNVIVRDLTGPVDVDTGSGNVQLENVSAEVTAQSGSGNMTVQGSAGPVRVSTGSGNVQVEGASGELYADTGSGNITVRDTRGQVRLETGSGNLRYQGAPSGDCRFETGSGSITLEVPDDVSMDVDLETGSGDIDLGFDVAGQVSRRDVRGTIGDGSQGSLRAHTGSGNIDLVRR
jgi:DUF4097 and DUF4098 domain-containing protein YvlB